MATDPSPPRIVGLDHVQITVPRGAEAAARRFYCGVLRSFWEPGGDAGGGGWDAGDRRAEPGRRL